MKTPDTRISLIAAVAENRVIGRGNKLPWYLPADLRHFKQLTMGKPMIMGRRTWLSLPGLLSGRTHIVVSRNRDFVAAGCLLAHSLDEAIKLAGTVPEIMIIGGAALYQEALPYASRMYFTLVHAETGGDVFFPLFDKADWREMDRESYSADAKNIHDYTFMTLERVDR
ncbi:MAG: dihydrofolate reductase [Gammaproteobacteria bacterium]|nr:dihydrofolate reductase [Gammaproteobacteria bacterium]